MIYRAAGYCYSGKYYYGVGVDIHRIHRDGWGSFFIKSHIFFDMNAIMNIMNIVIIRPLADHVINKNKPSPFNVRSLINAGCE